MVFAREILGIEPHPGQEGWLRGATKRQNLLVTGNRWGKSVAEAIRVLYHSFYQIRNRRFDSPGRYRVLCASITQDQAAIVWNEAVRLARSSPLFEPMIKEISRTPFPRLVLGNGSSIEARSTQNRGEYLLGHDYDLVVFDEVAFESHPDYVVNEVILMRLADREGALDLVSTPNGKNWFYHKMRELSENAGLGYVHNGDSRENPYISQDYLSQRLEFFSEDRVAQNIMGRFADSGREIISSELVDAALSLDCSADERSKVFVSGWDLARKRTATVGVTVAVGADGKVVVVELERFVRMDWDYVFARIRQRQERYAGRLVIDATGLGDVVIAELRDLAPIPFVFTEKSKAHLLANLEMFHARGRLAYKRFEIKESQGKVWSLEDELRSATWDDNNRCDGVMALALALWPLCNDRQVKIFAPRLSSL